MPPLKGEVVRVSERQPEGSPKGIVNEIFHESYSGDEAVEFYPNEHFINGQDGTERERVTDSCFGIRGKSLKKYHIECQSTSDDTMLVRMFEYDAQIALDAGEVHDGVLTVRFPASAILYLRCRAATPDALTVRIELPGGRSAAYDIPAMKAQRYTLEEIFSKGLLFSLLENPRLSRGFRKLLAMNSFFPQVK